MNGLNNLRRRPSETENNLLDYWQRHRLEDTPSVAPVLEEATPVLPEITPTNALLRATTPVTKPVTEKSTNALLDYWAQPVVGKVPLDKFVQIAGALSHAIAPQEPIGRVGGALSQIGGAAYAERVKEPENVLRRRWLEAQAKKLERPEIPTDWQALYQDLEGKIDPETGKVYTPGGKIKYFNKLKETLKEPTPQAQSLVHPKTGERKWFDMNTLKGIESAQKEGFIPYEKIKEPITKYQKVGETDKGLSLGYDSTTNKYVVTLKDGTIQPFDENIHGKKIEKETKVPSAGNVVDLAVKRKFGSDYLSDPVKTKEADKWLNTEEGKKGVREARDDLTSPAITFLQTAEGFIPVTTKGAEIGKVGQPTGLGKPLPPEMITTEQQIGTLKETLNRVKKSYDPGYVGFIAGRVGKLGEKTVGVGEKASSFYSDLAQLRNTLVYLMSGKQINEQEYKRLTEQMPVETMPVSTFNARMKNFEATLDSIIKERQKGMGGYGKQPQSTPNIPSTLTAEDFFKKKGIE